MLCALDLKSHQVPYWSVFKQTLLSNKTLLLSLVLRFRTIWLFPLGSFVYWRLEIILPSLSTILNPVSILLEGFSDISKPVGAFFTNFVNVLSPVHVFAELNKSVTSLLVCVWATGVLASDNLLSLPSHIVPAALPYAGKSVISDLLWVWTKGAFPYKAYVCSAIVPTAPSRIV